MHLFNTCCFPGGGGKSITFSICAMHESNKHKAPYTGTTYVHHCATITYGKENQNQEMLHFIPCFKSGVNSPQRFPNIHTLSHPSKHKCPRSAPPVFSPQNLQERQTQYFDFSRSQRGKISLKGFFGGPPSWNPQLASICDSQV